MKCVTKFVKVDHRKITCAYLYTQLCLHFLRTIIHIGNKNGFAHECVCYILSCSLVKRLEFGPAPPRGISQGNQSPQGGVKILL